MLYILLLEIQVVDFELVDKIAATFESIEYFLSSFVLTPQLGEGEKVPSLIGHRDGRNLGSFYY